MSLSFSTTQFEVLDEGSSQGQVSRVDFVGSSVSAAVSGDLATVTVSAPTTTPTMKVTFDFGNTGRYVISGFDGGVGANGVSLSSGSSSGNTTTVKAHIALDAGFNVYAGSPIFTTSILCNSLTKASGSGSSFFGIGQPTVAGSGHTYTVRHIGFKILKSGGTVSLYATQADGTTETASAALTTLSDSDSLDLIARVNGTSSVDYYYRKNGGSLSSATNLTTNIPSGTSTDLQFSVSNNSTAFTFAFACPYASYER